MKIINTVNLPNGKRMAISAFGKRYLTIFPKGARWKFSSIIERLYEIAPVNDDQRNFIDCVLANFNELLASMPIELEEFITQFEDAFPSLLFDGNKQTIFGKQIAKAFDYSGFRRSKKARWLTEHLCIKTCVYCNAQSTLKVLRSGTPKLLFQFDHFYSQDRYPYLSVSLFNLIPSCANCNIAKSKIQFKTSSHAHPYVNDLQKRFSFQADDVDVVKFLTNGRKDKIKITINSLDLYAITHKNLFSLEAIANEHSDIVEEFFMRAYYYDAAKRKEIIDELGGLIDEATIMRFILGNYYLEEDLNKRPLAKLVSDISRQVKLLDH